MALEVAKEYLINDIGTPTRSSKQKCTNDRFDSNLSWLVISILLTFSQISDKKNSCKLNASMNLVTNE